MVKYNTISKNLIRKEWGKKIIEFISLQLDSKLTYLGLPSPDAKDIEEWIENIDEVIAFQCRDYPNPSSPEQSKKNIEQLQEKLSEFERKGIISNYVVYDGYIEEVVLNRRDNSGIEFYINNTIHIFNLDFCNSITSPLEIVDFETGDVKNAYKFDVVKVLLELQNLVNSEIKKFVLFLTVKSSYAGKELEDFNSPITQNIPSNINKYEKKIRFLRHYVIFTLKNFFENNGFIAEFLPTIEYEGDGEHKLLHFTVVGTNKEDSATPVAPPFQKIEDLINERFITIKDKEFIEKNTSGISETSLSNCNPTEIFRSSRSYKKYWKK